MADREKVIAWLTEISLRPCDFATDCFDAYETEHLANEALEICEDAKVFNQQRNDALALIKEQEKKEIKLQKKHVITWKRDDEFTMRKLYEAICETLLDEGELIIVRIDDHEKVDFTFYVTLKETITGKSVK